MISSRSRANADANVPSLNELATLETSAIIRPPALSSSGCTAQSPLRALATFSLFLRWLGRWPKITLQGIAGRGSAPDALRASHSSGIGSVLGAEWANWSNEVVLHNSIRLGGMATVAERFEALHAEWPAARRAWRGVHRGDESSATLAGSGWHGAEDTRSVKGCLFMFKPNTLIVIVEQPSQPLRHHRPRIPSSPARISASWSAVSSFGLSTGRALPRRAGYPHPRPARVRSASRWGVYTGPA